MQKHKHKIIEASNGNTWIVRTDTVDAAAHLHVDKHEDFSGDRPFGARMRGYGGSVLEFELEDGGIYSAKGPWHSNSGAFYSDTGVLITDLTLTRLVLKLNDSEGEVIYEEEKPVLGPFMRGERIAHQLANLWEKAIYVESHSNGGSSAHTAQPDTMPHPMAVRSGTKNVEKDEAWLSPTSE